jgi:cell division protein FtsB
MREFQEKRQWKRTFRSRYFIVLLLILIALIGHGVWNAYVRYARSEVTIASLETERERLRDRERDLTVRVDALETPEGVDREIRTTYGLVKPDEELIVVVGGRSDSTSGTGLTDKSWWDRILDLFR